MEKLSNILLNDNLYYVEDVIDYCLDNGISLIVNDLGPEPMVEYSLSDLEIVWEKLRKLRKLRK